LRSPVWIDIPIDQYEKGKGKQLWYDKPDMIHLAIVDDNPCPIYRVGGWPEDDARGK